MAFGEEFSLITLVFYSLLYCTVFIMSVVGNSWIIVVTYQRIIKKRRFNHFTCLVANLAFADLVFISLTIFNFVSFYSDWPAVLSFQIPMICPNNKQSVLYSVAMFFIGDFTTCTCIRGVQE